MNNFYNDDLIDQMQNYRKESIKKLCRIIHPAYAEEFAKILYYSWQENLLEAEKIAERLDLFPIDFLALEGHQTEFRELLLKEKEETYWEDYG